MYIDTVPNRSSPPAVLLRESSRQGNKIIADMQLKERALAHATLSGIAPDRFRPSDPLLAFLESL